LISNAYGVNSKSMTGFGNVGNNDQKLLLCNCPSSLTTCSTTWLRGLRKPC
jgi:hypothetical protein